MCKDCGCSMGGSHHHSHDDHHNHHHHGHHDHPVLNEKKTIEVVEKILKDNGFELKSIKGSRPRSCSQ